MSNSRMVGLLFVGAVLLLVPLSQSHAIGVPTVGSLIGQEIASSIAFEALQQVHNDMSSSSGHKGYEKALKKYEKKLKKLMKKHVKLRKKEEQKLQRLLDDMTRYTPGDPEVNRKQEEKQKKVYEYAQQCQKNERMRAKKIEQLRDKHYPQLDSFIKNM